MKTYFLLFTATLFSAALSAQLPVKIFIKDHKTHEPVPAATLLIQQTQQTFLAGKEGEVFIPAFPHGTVTITVSAAEYAPYQHTLTLPNRTGDTTITFFLKQLQHEMEEVVVSTTRTGRSISNVPTRVEIIDLEEIEEKNNMRPSNVSMILHESTGIQVQQTSPTSLNSSIRIQGLDGRYTQLLKDGYANFGNFASGLSILEIPPLDLAQVEVIKGPASTLHGGGAIAGVVNFISKTPKLKPEYSLIASQSQIGQTTVGGFASHRNDKWGYTLLGLGNLQKPYDVDADEFTETAKSKDFTLHPKLFFFPNDQTRVIAGNSLTAGSRMGGDMAVMKGSASANHSYFEKNRSIRNTTTLQFDTRFDSLNHIEGKASLSYFERDIFMDRYSFGGRNYNVFTDISYSRKLVNHTWVLGSDFIYDRFREKKLPFSPDRGFHLKTTGLYLQNTWDISTNVQLESGLRGDAVTHGNNEYRKTEYFLLPRASVMFRMAEELTSRIGGGPGYKAPTLFTELTESMQYRNVLALRNVSAERSYGGTADINYKTRFNGKFDFSANFMVFYTRIQNALVLQQNDTRQSFFVNAHQSVVSNGFEANSKMIYNERLKLFAGYTFTNAKARYLPGSQQMPLVAKNRVNMVLFYETDHFKVGIEGYYADVQHLADGGTAPPFWDLGAMLEKRFGKISVFVNVENFTDARQSRIKSVVNGSHTNPYFDDIWSYHPEGRVISAGLKLKL